LKKSEENEEARSLFKKKKVKRKKETMRWVVASMFKDERPLLREWVAHYLAEGAEHFFLIDNGSTDAPEEVLAEFGSAVTLVRDAFRQPLGTQTALLNKHVLPRVRGGPGWVLVCDVDEYLYAQGGQTVGEVLASAPASVHKVWVPWKLFGSNGRTAQPEGVVQSFTRRASRVSEPYRRTSTGAWESHLGVGKMLTRTSHLVALDVHEAEVAAPSPVWVPPALQLNHYMFMARDYYRDVKCARGGGQTGNASGKYTMAYYAAAEPGCNEVEDLALLLKKKRR
jgi:hypothetical protein